MQLCLRLRFTTTALLLMAGVFGCGGKTPLPPVVVGHVATLSGPDRRAGVQAMRGIKLALEDVNKDAERRIEVRHTDTLGNLDSFEAEAIRLLSVNSARALLGGDSAEEVARLNQAVVPPDTKDYPVFLPIISPYGWRTPLMSKQVVLTGMTPQAEGKALARFAVDEKNVEQALLLVDQNDDRAVALADVFMREFVEARGKKAADAEPAKPRKLTYGAGTKLADVLAQLGDAWPQAVVVAGTKADLKLVCEKIGKAGEKSKQPGPTVLFSGQDGSLRADDWLTLTRNGNGPAICSASAFGLEKDNAAVEDFVQRFRKQFQEEPDVHAALVYESMKLLAEPLRSTFAEPLKLREEVFKLKDVPGLAGQLNFDGDQGVVRSLYVLRLEKDEMKVMKKYAP